MKKDKLTGKAEEEKAKLHSSKEKIDDLTKKGSDSFVEKEGEKSHKEKPEEIDKSKISKLEKNENESSSIKKMAIEEDGKKSIKKRSFSSYLLWASVFIGLGMLISFVSAIAIQKTSGVQFCGSCHSMKPMADAYNNSVHGGFGESGVVAKCADCHLPHDSLFGYIVQKGKSGMWDLWVETMRDTSKIDWFERREDKRHFVYDSGCLHCHENLLKATKLKSKPFVAHKAYFSNKLKVKEDGEWKKAQCVDCHKYVGHYQLEKHLPKVKEETSDELTEE